MELIINVTGHCVMLKSSPVSAARPVNGKSSISKAGGMTGLIALILVSSMP